MPENTVAVEQEEQKEPETSRHFYSTEQRIPFLSHPNMLTSLDEELFAFLISSIKTIYTRDIDFDFALVSHERHWEILISDYNGKVYSSGFEQLESVKKLIPLPNRVAIHAANGIQIWNTTTQTLCAQRKSRNDVEVSVVPGESFSFIVYRQNRSGTEVSLLELNQDLAITTEINLDYIGPENLFIKSFIFNNKAVILTRDGMFHVHHLPLSNNPPLHIPGIHRKHLETVEMNFHVWPEFKLMGMRISNIFNVWKIEDDLKTTEIQMDIPNAIFISKNPLPDGKLVYASVDEIYIFDPVDATSTMIYEENEPDCLLRGVSVMHDGRLGILKSRDELNYTLHLNNLTYLQKKWSGFLTDELNKIIYSLLLKEGVKQSQHQIIPQGVGEIINQYYLAPVAFFKPKTEIAEEKPQAVYTGPSLT